MKVRTSRIVRWILWGVGALLVWVAVLGLVDAYRVRQLKVKAASIEIGATFDSVVALMGRPNATFHKAPGFFGRGHKELAYGSSSDWGNAFSKQPPFFNPIVIGRWRMFCPDSDDIVVTLDDNDRVMKVYIPK